MAGKLMHALVYGGGDVGGVVGLKHVEVPIPSPSKDEVLIKMEAASLNPADWKGHKLRALSHPFLAWNSLLIPSTDVAGEVVEVGSGVTNFKRGDKVVTILNPLIGGGMSEYCVAEAKMTVIRPPEVSAAEGAGLPIACLTAHLALTQTIGLKLDGTGPSRPNILVTAASGGVGHYAVQLAKLGGAHVTATCGGRNVALVKSLGADEVLDYATPEGAGLRSPSGRKYDAVLHCAPTGLTDWLVFEPNLSENGIMVAITFGPRAMWTYAVKKLTTGSGKKLVPLILIPNGDHKLKDLVELVKEGKLRTVIDSKYSLSRGEEAWGKAIGGHATGKIIVEP